MIKVIRGANVVFATIAGLILLFIMLSISYGVITRSFKLASPIWIVQVNEYALVWVCFLATAWALAENKHVQVDILFSRFSRKGQTLLRLIQDSISIGLCGLLCYFGALSTWEHIQEKVVDVQSIDVPKALVIVVIPLGFLMLTLQFLIRAAEDVQALRGRYEHREG